MSKTIYNYNFTPNGDFIGTYTGPFIGNESTVGGELCEPGQIVKLAAGNDAWSQDPQIINGFLNGELTIESLQLSDWDNNLKIQWLEDYMKYVGLGKFITNISYMTIILSEAENINIFEKLSGPSIAYITKDSSTNEVSIGLNAYIEDFILKLALDQLSPGNQLRNDILSNHINRSPYITNTAKVTYQTYTDIVYGFDAYIFEKYILNTTIEHTLENGGGNAFGEIKLAGNGIQAKYIIKKNLNPNDPTIGLCSGDGPPLCMGDQIVIVDTTVWTENFAGTSGTGSWTWIGDYSQLDYIWHIADVTNPCIDYRNIPVSSILFPLRIIQFCTLENFSQT